MKWTDLFHSSEHLRVHHDLWRALTPALQQCEYRVRHDHGPVDGRWRMPGMPLAELIGAVDVRGPGHSGPALRVAPRKTVMTLSGWDNPYGMLRNPAARNSRTHLPTPMMRSGQSTYSQVSGIRAPRSRSEICPAAHASYKACGPFIRSCTISARRRLPASDTSITRPAYSWSAGPGCPKSVSLIVRFEACTIRRSDRLARLDDRHARLRRSGCSASASTDLAAERMDAMDTVRCWFCAPSAAATSSGRARRGLSRCLFLTYR